MKNATRLIPLTQGKFAIVDAVDFEFLSQWKWCANKTRPDGFGKCRWYAVRGTYPSLKTEYMHRVIAKRSGLRGRQFDHWDRNGLNNIRSNIRRCTQSQNNANTLKRAGCSSTFKGVYWKKANRNWVARITINGKSLFLGSFNNERDAGNAYAEAAHKHFREFARM